MNDSAFPLSTSLTHSKGLTKREYFAAHILQGLLAKDSVTWDFFSPEFAELSVRYADALIAELGKDAK